MTRPIDQAHQRRHLSGWPTPPRRRQISQAYSNLLVGSELTIPLADCWENGAPNEKVTVGGLFARPHYGCWSTLITPSSVIVLGQTQQVDGGRRRLPCHIGSIRRKKTPPSGVRHPSTDGRPAGGGTKHGIPVMPTAALRGVFGRFEALEEVMWMIEAFGSMTNYSDLGNANGTRIGRVGAYLVTTLVASALLSDP
ncbi:unnamed protein product [Caenorhabditis auriculariae]|uniref:Uncharacterized protein n=1 Tax=Caenorhabditis auriculariae TaxID=2777116 RepID=A0A8S1HWN9_9PELO|nr:unnamed protein product [Caenorhabditis auriculariae]